MMETEALSVLNMPHPDDARIPRSARLDPGPGTPRTSSEDNRNASRSPGLRSLSPASPLYQTSETSSTTAPSNTPSLTAEQTTELFRRKLDDVRSHNDQALEKEGVTHAVSPKLTLNLGQQLMTRLPEAVIDLIKEEVDRLSLANNQIWHIPLRIQECSHLRYLNVRSNQFREIPRGVYKLPHLEILDISRNKVRMVSKEIKNLTSLRVLSVQNNNIEDLPTEICELNMLEMVKLAENPLKEKLKRVIRAKEAEVSWNELTEPEKEKAMTIEIKRHLRSSHPIVAPIDVEAAQQYEESPMETPKPAKRIPSSRFPVIPQTGSTDGSSPPTQPNPPPIPTRSHYRVVSGQSMAIKRPGIAPLISSERLRSNSENVVQNPRAKRMGMVRNKKDLDSIEESKANRLSHLRGFSHASALKRASLLGSTADEADASSPNSPREGGNRRNEYVKRLSSLPEYKWDAEWQPPTLQGARGVLYALYQIHPQISGLIAAIRGREAKRTSLEAIFYYASTYVDRLNSSLERADATDPNDTEAVGRAVELVTEDCAHCIIIYQQVSELLQHSVRRIVAGSDPRYVRTLMLLLYGSILEIRNAITSVDVQVDVIAFAHKRQRSGGNRHPIQTIQEEQVEARRSITPTRSGIVHQRPGFRQRSDTTIQHTPPETIPAPQSAALPNQPTQLNGTATNGHIYNGPVPDYVNGHPGNGAMHSARSRSNSRNTSNTSGSMASSIAGTPRSGDGFHLPRSTSYFARINPATGLTESQEEAQFGQIFLALTRAYEAALSAVPTARDQFVRCLDAARDRRQDRMIQDQWSGLMYRCGQCYDITKALQMRLTNMRVKDEAGRNDPAFWALCKSFLQSFVDLVTDMREVRRMRLLPQEHILILRPVQKASQQAGRLIDQSPWRNMTDGVSTMPAPTPYASTPAPPLPPPVRSDSYGVNAHPPGPPIRSDSYAYSNGHGQGDGYPIKESQVSVMNPPPLMRMHTSPSAFTSAPAVQPLIQPPDTATFVPSATAYPGFDRLHGPSPLTSPLPATPLSAALGPAAQATIPTSAPNTAVPASANPMSAALAPGPGWTIKPQNRDMNHGDIPPTPSTASLVGIGDTDRSASSAYGGDHVFRGNVFQRADTLLSSMNGNSGMNWSIRR
jgi:Leucine-rich repeat (LRR) protein